MKKNAGWRRIAIRLVLICLAGVILLAVVRPASAAYVLKYFTATTINNQLLLEWETLEEYNISGFEILCKEELEPDELYHPIGTRPAVGSLESSVAYNFLVEEGLKTGVTYCFRLREITTDGSPPQYNDICGYGINIDAELPTPVVITPTIAAGLIAGTPTVVQVLLPTPITGEGTPITIDSLYANLDSGPISISGPSPLPTSTPTPTLAPPVVLPQSENPASPGEQESPLPTPTTQVILPQPESPLQSAGQQSPLLTPISDGANESPLPTPIATDELTAAGANNRTTDLARSDDANQQTNSPLDTSQTRNGDAGTSAISSPTPMPTFTLTASLTPTWTPTLTPVAAVTPLETEQPVALADGERAANEQAVNAQGLNLLAQSTPSYIVVTATSTPLNATPLATFTPYPTALPANQVGLFALANPTVENLILLTLCFIFLGAGGIGMLGLTATMLYIRSRREPQSQYQVDQFDIDGYDLNRRIDRQLDQVDQLGPSDDWLR